ncbi:MAG: glycosyltransferase [Planctomycetota bacterium]
MHAGLLTVVIPAYRRPELLTRTLSSLSRVNDLDRIAKVWVAENDTESSLEGIVAPFSGRLPVRYLFHPQPGKSGALNEVLERCDDGLIVFLDDDVRVSPATIITYWQAWRDCPQRAYFGGPCGVDYESPPDERLLCYMTWSTTGWHLGDQDGWLGRRQHFLGCNWAVQRRDILAIGGFDRTFGPGATTGATGQESNAQRRLAGAGLRGRYLASARVWHHVAEHQVRSDWILQRRQKAGLELGRIVAGKVTPKLRVHAVHAAIQLLKIRFRCQNLFSVRDASFHRKWWAAYRDGAMSAVRGVES